MILKETIDHFNHYISFERQLSSNTVSKYVSSLRRFNQITFKNEDLHVNQIKPEHIHSYIQYVGKTLSLAPKSIHLEICALRSFAKFLFKKKLIEFNFCADIENPKLPAPKPNPFRDEEIEIFFESIDTSNPTGMRDYILFHLALRSGLRASELVNLSIYDLALNDQILYVRNGKGGKDRNVPLSQYTCNLLREYITTVRITFVKDVTVSNIFVTHEGHAFSSSYPRKLAMKYKLRAGLTYRRASPHIFRYTFATQVSKKSKANINVLQELLGHEDINTTARYVGVNENDKREAVEGLDL